LLLGSPLGTTSGSCPGSCGVVVMMRLAFVAVCGSMRLEKVHVALSACADHRADGSPPGVC
jgi:hypothetical protein